MFGQKRQCLQMRIDSILSFRVALISALIERIRVCVSAFVMDILQIFSLISLVQNKTRTHSVCL